MAVLWSDEARFARWLEVELLATEGHAELGLVPSSAAETCRRGAPTVDAAFVSAVLEREEVTNHDVAAFVDVVQAAIGAPDGSWIHFGLTSSDVVDSALCWALRDAADLIIESLVSLRSTMVDLAERHRDTVTIGRTHGIHAEPTTFGAKVALWALQVDRDLKRLTAARDAVAVMKLSGAVGTYSNIPPAVEAHVGAALGLSPVPATQVIARDRHAELLYACASIAATCELVAVELRHLQRTEVREVLEGFAPGQKGSSAMPHKRNPITWERITGLSRVLRGNAVAAMENVALWHERDISHSSVERVIFPDSCTLLNYMFALLQKMMDGLNVYPKNMEKNLGISLGMWNSQTVLLALIRKGLTREDAYALVQRNAMETWAVKHAGRDDADFLEQLMGDPDVSRHFKKGELEELCSVKFHQRHINTRFKQLGL